MHPSAIWLILSIFANTALRNNQPDGPICSSAAGGDVDACSYVFEFDPLASYYRLPSSRDSRVILSWTSQPLKMAENAGGGENVWYNVTIPTNNAHLRYMRPEQKTIEAVGARIVEVGMIMNDFEERQNALDSLRTLAEINVLVTRLITSGKPIKEISNRQIDLYMESDFSKGQLLGDGVIG